jgi:hypothetical protein
MSISRAPAVGAVVLLALVAAILAGPAGADAPSHVRSGPSGPGQVAQRDHPGDELRMDVRALAGPLPALDRDDGAATGTFVGADGVTYDAAPLGVAGRHGTVYFGPDFDLACHWGHEFDLALQRLAKFAAMIRRSGRQVLFTVAPNKSSVNKRDLPATLPHGRCAGQGIHAEDLTLDHFRHSAYVPLRQTLAQSAATRHEVYWHLDTHWTSVGATDFAQAVAERLDPKVASLQRYRKGKQTIYVDLNNLGLMHDVYETGPALTPTTPVKVRASRGSAAYNSEIVSPSLSWRTRPAKRTVGGRTLLLGDSFTYRALPSLMPLFDRGDFMWVGLDSPSATIRSIRRSDTVVIEVVQRFLPVSWLTSPDFRRQVASALR